MNLDPQAELKSLYQDKKKVSQSLMDRLNSIDQYAGTVNPMRNNTLSGIGRAPGESPLNVIMSALKIGEETTRSRNNTLSDLDSSQGQGMDLLKTLINAQNADRQFGLDALKAGVGADGAESYSDAQAIAKVQAKYGKDVELGRTIKERGERARSILKMVDEGSSLPINDLLSVKEKAAREAATALMNSAGEIYSSVVDQKDAVKNAAGVGQIEGWYPSWLTGMLDGSFGQKGNDLRSKVTKITADKIKELSGAAVSDREVQRLANMLPQQTDTEQTIASKTKTIMNSLKVGLAMQEKAKLENLTLDQAYEKYGAKVYSDMGEEIPSWLKPKTKKGDEYDNLLDEMGF